MYKLRNEDLTHLGGPMGAEYTTTRYNKYFTTVDKAKNFAEKEYGKPINWTKYNRSISSGDLGYVMYDITLVEIEE